MIIETFDHIVPAVLAGGLLDLLLGDPHGLYHPVQLIGKGISFFESLFRKLFPEGKAGERTAGVFTAVCVIILSTLVPSLILMAFYHINFWLGFALETFWCYQLLAARSLHDESMKVYRAVKTGDLQQARKAVSMIVGRDTERLDMTGVTKAAVETVAENASDGVVAPLLFLMIGGAVGGFFYKSVNTMDSMIGYVNDRYRWFGTFAAKLDDVLNFIPARVSAVLMVLAAFLTGHDGKNAWKIMKRDRLKHASPNSAHTEAAMAGALDVQLAGDAWYFGVLHRKPYIGDPIREITPEDIPASNRIMYVTAVLACIFAAAIRILLLLIF